MIRSALSLVTAAFILSLGATSALAAGPPLISGTSFSEVTETSATLEGFVDPNGRPTEYRFEYIEDAAYRANPEAERFTGAKSTPEVEIPATPTGPQPASAPITGLDPGTTYHLRIFATNNSSGNPIVFGPERIFATYATPLKGLPDGRAYEQATPVDKNGNDATGTIFSIKASVEGDAVTFLSNSGIPGGSGSQNLPLYLASRGPTGWSNQGLLPPGDAGQEARVLGWLPDFSGVFDLASRLTSPFSTALLGRSSSDGSLTTIAPYSPKLSPEFAGASADGSAVVFESATKLAQVPAAIEGKSNVYIWDRDSGQISLASTLNDGQAPPGGAFAGSYDWVAGTNPTTLGEGGAAATYYTQDQHAISASGDVFFTAAKTGQLYLRENPTETQSPVDLNGKCTDPTLACTINISATQKTKGKGPNGSDAAGTRPAAFMGATPDGSKVFFTSSEKLTDDANTGTEPELPAIARAEIGDGTGKDLSFLPARTKGIAVDGSHIYWADPEGGTIGRATLDGTTEIDDAFIEGAGKPQWVAVDSEHVYWTNAGDGEDGHGTIGRADIDGDNPKLDFITDASNPQGIAVNGTHIYWGNRGADEGPTTRGIGRADLDGGNPEQSFDGLAWNVSGVALDGTYIYFTSDLSGNIERINLVEPKDFNSILFTSTADKFQGIAVTDTYIYWANNTTNTIGRATLNNPEPNVTEVKPEFIKDAGHPQGLAADASHLYWSANQGAEPNPGNDLYRYDGNTGDLIDLTVDSTATNGAEVKGVLGTSADGSYVYFAANGVLSGAEENERGESASQGNCQGTPREAKGECNLYLWHEGQLSFIAKLDADGGKNGDAYNWLPTMIGASNKISERPAHVSPDGRTLLFRSQAQLTAYENKGISELYRYRAGEPGLSCVSCNPTGESPTSPPTQGSIYTPAYKVPDPAAVLSHNLSSDGNRVFFESTDKLVVTDTNGENGCPLVGSENQQFPSCLDVYQWEAEGSGSCETPGGCIHLISTGKSNGSAILADASASGDDVFFFTRSRLVGQDEDDLFDIYDARVGGGLASQNEVAPVPCEGEGCKPGLSPSGEGQSPGTAAFVGPANPKGRKTCPKSKRRVASKGKTRCVAKKQQRQKHRYRSERRARR